MGAAKVSPLSILHIWKHDGTHLLLSICRSPSQELLCPRMCASATGSLSGTHCGRRPSLHPLSATTPAGGMKH